MRSFHAMSHGGEHRAVFVYQIESYRYWQEQLSQSVGRVEPAFVTAVKVVWSLGRSSTNRSRSTGRLMATFSYAVHSLLAMSSSICKATCGLKSNGRASAERA